MKPTKNGSRGAKLPTLTATDALGMLASAVNYCRTAGLDVRTGNTAAGLTLCLPAARLTQVDGDAEFILTEVETLDSPAR